MFYTKNIFAIFFCSIIVHAIAVSAQRTASWGLFDPLGYSQKCGPLPNDFFVVRDPSTTTGLRINFTSAQLPRDRRNDPLKPLTLRMNNRDGFGVGGPIVFSLGGPRPNLENAASWKNISISLSAGSSPSLLIDLGPIGDSPSSSSKNKNKNKNHHHHTDYLTQMIYSSNMTLIPHWLEQDKRSQPLALEEEEAMMIYPSQMLTPQHRYAVVIRNLKNDDVLKKNELIKPSAAFASLINGKPDKSEPSIYDRSPQFFALFQKLQENYNIPASSLQLAWFFTTESDGSQLDMFRYLKKDALSRVPVNGPKFYFNHSATKKNPNNLSSAYMYGHYEVPLYLNSAKPGGTFVMDKSTGLPAYQRLVNVSFTMVIPKSFEEQKNNKNNLFSFLHVGHGLFQSEIAATKNDYEITANTNNMIVICVNWWGLAGEDVPFIMRVFLDDFNALISIPDRLNQAMINQLYLTKMFKLSLSSDDFFKGRLNTEKTVYSGDSLAGIEGAVLVAASDDLNDAVLRVEGSSWGLLLPRSWAFFPLWDLLVTRGYSVFERIVMVHLMDFELEPIGPPGFLRHLQKGLDTNFPNRVAMLHGLSDALVTSIAGEVSARTVDAVRFPNTVHEEGEEVFGFGPVIHNKTITFDPAVGGVVFQLYDFGFPPIPFYDTPVSLKYNTHSCVQNDPRARSLMINFFSAENSGEFKDYCDGKGCQPLPAGEGAKCPNGLDDPKKLYFPDL